MVRCLIVLLLTSVLMGCSTSSAAKLGALEWTITSSLIDPRVGEKHATIKKSQTSVDVYKDPVSEQAAEAAVELAPVLADAIVKALMAQLDADAIPSLLKGMVPEEATGEWP